jgi:hypothetical protein
LYSRGYFRFDIDNIDNTVNNNKIDNNIDTADNNIDNILNSIGTIDKTIIIDKKSDEIPVGEKIIDDNSEDITYKLKCPNNEIFYALIQEFIKMDSPFPGFNGSINKTYSSFVNSFDSLDVEGCERTFSSFLGQTVPTLNNLNETTFQTLLLCLLNINKTRARLEQIVGSGRCDVNYKAPNNILIVTEIKYSKDKINKMSPQPTVYPPPDAMVPAFPEMAENVKKILEALKQIVSKKYYEFG